MMKKILVFVSLLFAGICVNAQNQGVYYGSERIDGTLTSFGISSEDSVGVVLRFANPVSNIPLRVTWRAEGGVEFVGYSSKNYVSNECDSTWTVAPQSFYEIRVRSVSNDYVKGENRYCKYSKGRVSVIATYGRHDLCEETELDRFIDRSINYQVNILKLFNPNIGNSIVGPACAKAGDEVTFSVAPWVSSYHATSLGYDEYVWSGFECIAKDGALKYYSNDRSSITFEIADSITSLEGTELTCKIGAKNISSEKTLRFVLSDGQAAPFVEMFTLTEAGGFLSQGRMQDVNSGISNCVAYTSSDFRFVVDSIAATVQTAMAFRVDGDWMDVESVDGHFDFSCQEGKEFDLRVTIAGGSCGSQDFFYRVSRALPDNINIIFTDASECAYSGTRQIVAEGVADGTLLHWSIETPNSNWRLMSNVSTYSPTVYVGRDKSAIFHVSSPSCPSFDADGNQEFVLGELFSKPSAPSFQNVQEFKCVMWGDSTGFDVRVKIDTARTNSLEWILPAGWRMVSSATLSDTTNTYFTPVLPDSDGIVTVRVASDGRTSGYLRVKARGQIDCAISAIASQKVGMTYPRPNLELVEGCEVTGGSITIRANEVSGFHSPRYYWDLEEATTSINSGIRTSSEVTFDLRGDRGPSSYCVRVYPVGSCDIESSTDSLTIAAASDFFISYDYSGRVSSTSKQNMHLEVLNEEILSDDLDYSAIWTVQSFDDEGNVRVQKLFKDETDISLKYIDFKPGERVHINIAVICYFTDDEEENDNYTLPCMPTYDFDFVITRESGELFLPEGELRSLRIQADTEEVGTSNVFFTSDGGLYPNPTSGNVSMPLPKQTTFMMKVYGSNGEIVHSHAGEGDSVSADLSFLPTGVYTYVITTDSDSFNGKIIKK